MKQKKLSRTKLPLESQVGVPRKPNDATQVELSKSPEYLPMRIGEVIDDIKECTENMVSITARLNDIIIMLSTPIFIAKEKIK